MKKTKYKREPIGNYKSLGFYPVYIKGEYTPFKIVGIRENQVLLEGDFSVGTRNVWQTSWVDDEETFVIREVCKEELEPNGCQVHNVNCCGGGNVVRKNILDWDNVIKGIKMIQMIELTHFDGKPRLVNLSLVTDVGLNSNGDTVICFKYDNFLQVKESYEEVKAMIIKSIETTGSNFTLFNKEN